MDTIIKYFPELSETQRRQMAELEALYPEWNAKINVISRKDIDNLEVNHLLHSLGVGTNASAVLTNVNEGIITSSPGPMSQSLADISSACVQLVVRSAFAVPVCFSSHSWHSRL